MLEQQERREQKHSSASRQVCLVGTSRSYKQSDEAEFEQRRACYIRSRQTSAGAAVQSSGVGKNRDCCHGSTDCEGTSGTTWEGGFRPRSGVEAVRNCAALPRDFVDGIVLKVADTLLGMSEGTPLGAWNKGGSLSVKEVAALLQQETLQLLKKECGGLQTLLKNNHQVFKGTFRENINLEEKTRLDFHLLFSYRQHV
ncbi:hypothetical protein AMECASPLE_030145 [Ameca splendens]|uniref:tRNA (uracil-O(2)-)-methyltransferase n=1 Tax=Ameca splendens TaxID=208324 RepID=A0ABV0XJ04_9TELE